MFPPCDWSDPLGPGLGSVKQNGPWMGYFRYRLYSNNTLGINNISLLRKCRCQVNFGLNVTCRNNSFMGPDRSTAESLGCSQTFEDYKCGVPRSVCSNSKHDNHDHRSVVHVAKLGEITGKNQVGMPVWHHYFHPPLHFRWRQLWHTFCRFSRKMSVD